jgi:hypothetical protein
MDDAVYPKPKRQWRAAATPFSGPIPDTAGTSGKTTQPRRLGDKPLSVSAQEYADRLWRETDATIRYDLARYGKIVRWSEKTLGQLQEERKKVQSA